MTKEQKLAILSERLHILTERGVETQGICNKVAREIRKLERTE